MKSRRTSRYILLSVVMIAVAVLVGIPLYYIVVNTLKTQDQMVASPLGLPSQLYLGNYQEVFAGVPLARAFLNTLYVTVDNDERYGMGRFLGALKNLRSAAP